MDETTNTIESLKSRISDLRERLSSLDNISEPTAPPVIEEPKVQEVAEVVQNNKEAEQKRKNEELNAMKAKLLGGKKK